MSDYYYTVTNLSEPVVHFMHIDAKSEDEAKEKIVEQLSDNMEFKIERITDIPVITAEKPFKRKKKHAVIHF